MQRSIKTNTARNILDKKRELDKWFKDVDSLAKDAMSDIGSHDSYLQKRVTELARSLYVVQKEVENIAYLIDTYVQGQQQVTSRSLPQGSKLKRYLSSGDIRKLDNSIRRKLK